MLEKVSFETLKLSKEVVTKTVMVNGIEVFVKQYLPVEEKMSLINIAVEESRFMGRLIDKAQIDALFHIYLVMSYTNIEIKNEEEEYGFDILEAYDILEQNGVIDLVINAIPEEEYAVLVDYLRDAINDQDKFNTSFVGVLTQLLENLPTKLDEVNQGLENFDLEKFKPLVEAMKTVGGDEKAVMNLLTGQK